MNTGTDKWVKKWVVPSSSGGGDYIVAQDKDGNWACSCPGWTRHIYCPICEASIKKGEPQCPHCGCVFGGKYNPVRHDCSHICEVRDYGRGETLADHVIAKLAGRRD
jgi:hypothetical protein